MKRMTEAHDAPARAWKGGDLQRTKRIKDLLIEVLQRDEGERASFIAAADDDPFVRTEVLRLVAAHHSAGTFMSDPSASSQAIAESVPPSGEQAGAMIGRYRLVRLIGEGGFGSVYLAEQLEPVVRQVALKIIKLGMDTRQVIARFEAERQVLAMMEHPGIARVIDAGATDSGRPYFVMELVEGVPITTYCDDHQLNLGQRLQVFMQLCDAVQYAHMKGVIHRDLKPTNLMVVENNGHSTAKVIDFGIAKATSGRFTDGTVMTEFRQLLGTPEYMSPEQADPDTGDIDTRADVYSLGIVLYELLTGSTPLDRTRLQSVSFGNMQRMVREEEAVLPSDLVTSTPSVHEIARQRGVSVSRLISQLRGDLDWVVLKALEKDRERRYASPAALADDIRRHLAHKPVVASPRGMGYRLRKLARRHRAAAIATAMVVLAFVVGTTGTLIGLVRARDASMRASQAAALAQTAAVEAAAVNDFMREFLTSVDPDQDGAHVALADVLDEASATAGRRFAGQPRLEAQTRDLLGHVYMRLGRLRQAETEFRQCADLWHAAAGPDDPRTIDAMLGVGLALVNQERASEAQQYLGDFIPKIEAAFDARDRRRWEGYAVVADALCKRGKVDESEQILRNAIAAATSAGADEVSIVWLLNSLTGTLRTRIGQDSSPTTIEQFRASASELLERASRCGKAGQWFVRNARSNLADAAFLTRSFADAAAQTRALLQETSGILDDCQVVRTGAMIVLAKAISRMGEIAEAADLYIHAIECMRSHQVGGGDNLMILAIMCDSLPILDRAGRWVEGERYAHEVVAMLSNMGGHIGTETFEAYEAHFISEQGRFDEAQAIFDALLHRPRESLDPTAQRRLGASLTVHHLRQSRLEEAERCLQALAATVDLQRECLNDGYPEELPVLFITLHQARGETAKVEEYEGLRQRIMSSASSGAP